ncbi:MAG: DNA mismatch repair endonuclease MutL [Saprospiraceae bacterium]
MKGMGDIIQLLPDAIANQIAAGEVIQRPASALKELLENAIDAGAGRIQIIIKDGGKTLIQVLDDGKGMSETDARMSFERHATSKIRSAEDLFLIKTMGFRGEALASIAAVAQVEMKTRQEGREVGVELRIEGSRVISQGPVATPKGTSISVKNLFYNIPARRNFLKGNETELKHILDEFQRIALANPAVGFQLFNHDAEMYQLQAGNLRQRLVGLLGANCNQKLIPVETDSDILVISGFIGKPEFARRSRNEQFLFVNNRFIKSPYLNHAIMHAYDNLLKPDSYPLYAIFLEIDPAAIDINVHPTKQEIKFEDEKLVYQFLTVAVKHALGQFSLTPMIDFEVEGSFAPALNASPPANRQSESTPYTNWNNVRDPNQNRSQSARWQQLYEGIKDFDQSKPDTLVVESKWSTAEPEHLPQEQWQPEVGHKAPVQYLQSYLITERKDGILVIDQQAAHERILFEEYLLQLSGQDALIQQELFPRSFEFSTQEAIILRSLLPFVQGMGFDLQDFGGNTFVLQGIPGHLPQGIDPEVVFHQLLDQYRNDQHLKSGIQEKIARSLARSTSLKKGVTLHADQMQELIDKLFACNEPLWSPNGQRCFVVLSSEELQSRFAKGF